MKIFRWISGIAALVCALPLLSLLFAGTMASLAGCELHEGFVNPCLILGADWGGLLYGMGVMGWLFLATGPVMIFILGLWALVEIIAFVKRRVL